MSTIDEYDQLKAYERLGIRINGIDLAGLDEQGR
ncbi:hypothetical protein ACVIKO_004834 [Rhizobium ruizarguesonis]